LGDCADFTVIVGIGNTRSSIIISLPWHASWNINASMSELVVIVLRDFVTDFTSVGGIIPTNLFYVIPILPWLAIVEVIAQIIFPIIPLGGFADCTSISVVKVTRVSS
jgi:hypothetical protein